MGRKVRRRAEVEERGRRAKSEGGEEQVIFIIDHECCSLKGFILYVHQQLSKKSKQTNILHFDADKPSHWTNALHCIALHCIAMSSQSL